MGGEKNGGTVPAPERAPESIVAFYITQESGLPSKIQGLGQTVVAINVRDPSGSPMQKPALKVTFPPKQSVDEPVGLVAFGSDHRCHFVLPANDASEVHCKVWAQLNSGPDVWIIEDSSTHGTQVTDEENLHSGKTKIIHGRRQASKGLQTITIHCSKFYFRPPISNVELRERKDWFRCNPPIPVTKAMLDRQVCNNGYDLCRMDLGPVGEGGNAKVYRYMEKNTALFIAIKEEQTKSKEHKAMILKEINFMKSLHHVRCRHRLMTFTNFVKPFLVDILFDDSDNKSLPMVLTAMPLYRGHLGSILPLPNMLTTERVMLQIAEGLRFMHSNLVLHRDLKPANILVVSPGNVKIADYGWATSLKDTDSLYGVCGTTAYCAPEAFKPSEIHTPAIDVYSLGAVFYTLLDLDKVERGWVMREFRGEEAIFNTTFENASVNPPHRFTGLIQSMLAPNPEGRCSVGECIEIVKAQKYDWTKRTPLIPVAMPTHLAAGQLGAQRVSNATRLQQTAFDQVRATDNIPKLNPFARVKRPQARQHPLQPPVKHDYKNWQPVVQRKEPAAPTPQVVPTQKPCKPALVRGVNFNAGLPSYEEATRQNPFAVKASKGEKDKMSSHAQVNINDKFLGYRTKEPPVQPLPLAKIYETPKQRSLRVETLPAVKILPQASIRGQQPRHSRQNARRSRGHAINIHRAQDAAVHKRREQPERQAARNRQVADLKKGVCDVAKGYCVFYRALFGLAFEGLAVGGERIYRMFNDNAGARKALEHVVPSMNADAQLMASVQMASRNATLSNRLLTGSRQRSFRVYTDEEMMDHQLMRVRRR